MTPAPRTAPRTALATAALVLAAALAACTSQPNTGRMAVADGVRFDYGLKPSEKANTYHLTLALSDAKSGAAIKDANVAVSVFGPGYDGNELINLKRDDAGAYAGDVVMPKPASYNLTFQVNRTTASAEAVFAATPPAQVASAAGAPQPAR